MNQQLLINLTTKKILLDSGAVNGHAVKRAIACNDNDYANVVNITSFLPEDVSFAQRIYCIKNNITASPTCSTCNVSTVSKFNSTTGYQQYCSTACSNRSNAKKLTTKQTNLVKYGGHPQSNEHIRNKTKATNLAKHGSEEILAVPDIQEQIKQTNLERYGAIRPHLVGEGKRARAATMIEKYGVEYPMQSSEHQQKVADIIMSRYGVTSTAKLDSTKATAAKHIKANRYTHPSIYDNLNNREWLLNQHITLKKTPTQIAGELSLADEKSVTTKLREFSIDVISYNPKVSSGELQVLEFIQSIAPSAVGSERTIIHPQELDIFIAGSNIAIEYCGLYWHSEKYKDRWYHEQKRAKCAKAGIQLITLFEDEWIKKQNVVKQKLAHAIGRGTAVTIGARVCQIRMVGSTEKQLFFDANHVQGDGPSSINYGLYSDDLLVACIGFIEKNNGIYVLNRYATSCNVPGGFSRLLTHFKSNHSWNTIESFADLRWSTGKLYDQTGFTLAYTIPPDYYWTSGTERLHKFGFRHKHLAGKLTKYDSKLTEDANCRNNGLWKIYDCGKLKYVMHSA